MFNPTKPHKEEIKDGQPSIRYGSKVPDGAVGLSYIHVNPLTPEENLQITDLSGFTLENAAGSTLKDEDLWPNDQGLLTAWDGNPYLHAKSFQLTNQFLNGVPLYFAHVLEYPAVGRGTSEDVMRNILIQDRQGNPVDDDRLVKVVVRPDSIPNHFLVRIFTDFQVQPNEDLRVSYTAFKDGRVVPGYTERLSPSVAFERSRNLEETVLIPNRHLQYYQAEGKEIGQSLLYVGSVPIRDLDYRQPVPFRYRITGRATKAEESYVVTTPWLYGSVFNGDNLSDADTEYRNGHKIMDERPAIELLSEFGDTTPFKDPEAKIEFVAESSDERVEVYTQEDGMNQVLAFTEESTGSVRLPDDYKRQHRSRSFTYAVQLKVNDDEPIVLTGSISIMDGHKKIAGPFTDEEIEVALLRPYDPVNIYMRDNSLYVYTTETDVFYVPRFSIRSEGSTRVRVLPPAGQSGQDEWYVRVQNGQFIRRGIESGFSVDRYYNIPEYFRQDFDEELGAPFRKVLGEKPRIIGPQKIRLNHYPLHIARDRDTGLLNIEVRVSGVPVQIGGWNTSDGTVELSTRIRSTDDVTVDYYYEEHAYTYRGFYDKETDRYWHLDLNPGAGHYYTDLHPVTGEIEEVPGFHLINRTIYLYMRASARFTEQGEMVRGSYKENALFHTFHELDEDDLVLLAKLRVRPNSRKEDLKVIDIRSQGGGVIEDLSLEEMKRIEPESIHYWDVGFWDGEPYFENGVAVIRLPKYILKENGGKYSQEDVEEIIHRHIAYGVLPIIEYTDVPIEVLPVSNSITSELVYERRGG